MRSRMAALDEALRKMDPLANGGESPIAAGADELLVSIVSSDPRDESQRSTPAAHRPPAQARRRRLLIAVPVGAALLAILVTGLPSGGGDGEHTLPVLARVAEAAAALPPIDDDLPYVYLKTRSTGISIAVTGGRGWSYHVPTTRELWISRDGSGRSRITEEPGSWVSAADREDWEGAPPFSQSGNVTEVDIPPGRFFNDSLPDGTAFAELPTDPTDLAAWLEQRVQDPKAGAGAGNGFSVAVRTLAFVTEVLSNPLVPPDLRAALYEAEGLIPGIEYLGEVTDELGRHGVAVGAESANSGAPTIYSLVFDPETSQVLASREEVLEAPASVSDGVYPRTESTLYLASGAASSLGGKPRIWSPTRP